MSAVELMGEVEEVFKLAFDQALYTRHVNNRIEIVLFVDDLIRSKKPFSLVNEEGIKVMTDEIFNNEVAIDFVEDLKFHFFSRWGYVNNRLQSLCENLSFGVSADFNTTSEDFRSTPDDHQDRYPNYEDTTAYLMSNKWVIVLLLIQLCIRLEDKVIEEARKVMEDANSK